jgi:ubiquitin C-terminal hydrolase
MKGFINIGNTCYLNSGLQMLIQNKNLCEMILKYMNSSPLLKIIGNFINEYYSEGDRAINPIRIKQLIQGRQSIFSGYQQQDSTEFIIYLLDLIDEEIKKIDKQNKGLYPLFGIEFNSRIKCKLRECLKINNTKEFNNILLLDIDSNTKSLEDAYHKLKSGEKLDGDNKYFCDNCKEKRIASKRTSIENWPNFLFIWLKRFNQTGRFFSKNAQKIEIPLKWRHDNYLQGAVIHSGSLNGGHYVYVGKHDDKWYLFNDSHISEINNLDYLNELLSSAYWLCYKKIIE